MVGDDPGGAWRLAGGVCGGGSSMLHARIRSGYKKTQFAARKAHLADFMASAISRQGRSYRGCQRRAYFIVVVVIFMVAVHETPPLPLPRCLARCLSDLSLSQVPANGVGLRGFRGRGLASAASGLGLGLSGVLRA